MGEEKKSEIERLTWQEFKPILEMLGFGTFNLQNSLIDLNENDIKIAKVAFEMFEARIKHDFPEDLAHYQKLDLKSKVAFIGVKYPEISWKCDQALLETSIALLRPLLERVISKSYLKETKEYQLSQIFPIAGNLGTSGTSIARSTYLYDLSVEEKTLALINHYKTCVEGVFKWNVRVIARALALDGREYFRGTKHAPLRDYGQIKKENLAHLLAYLRKEGFGVLSDACNPKLRNAIAHEDYQILPDGSILYWDGREVKHSISQKELIDLVAKLNGVCFSFSQSFATIVQELTVKQALMFTD